MNLQTTNLMGTSIKLLDNKLYILDQQLLPQQEVWIEVKSVDQLIDIIKQLKVRGAPLIGVAAAVNLALSIESNSTAQDFFENAKRLRNARPTAVNLMNAIDRMLLAFEKYGLNFDKLMDEARQIFTEDQSLCLQMAKIGGDLIKDGDKILTHCNTGGLATAGVGTALGAITYAYSQKKNIHVYVDETRPLLQGARLTAWELKKTGIPHTLICDNMAGFLMAQKKVDKIFVGSDRIAMNGDFANKIGTYSLAVLAKHHGVAFYVVAPKTTVDFNCNEGAQIPIEGRKNEEVLGVSGAFGDVVWADKTTLCYNPAFDVTPADLVTGIIIDNKLFTQPELKQGKLKELF